MTDDKGDGGPVPDATSTGELALDARAALPDALRVLLRDYPRAAWQAHPNFTGLVQFWLERHLAFRQMLDALEGDVQVRLDAAMAPEQYARRLSRIGSMLVGQLHGHHHIEDDHYFPMLQGLDARLERGFEILDRDHQALDPLLARFTDSANAALRADGAGGDEAAARDAVGALAGELALLHRLLDRHLTDEEEIIVPVILRHGPGGLA